MNELSLFNNSATKNVVYVNDLNENYEVSWFVDSTDFTVEKFIFLSSKSYELVGNKILCVGKKPQNFYGVVIVN